MLGEELWRRCAAWPPRDGVKDRRRRPLTNDGASRTRTAHPHGRVRPGRNAAEQHADRRDRRQLTFAIEPPGAPYSVVPMRTGAPCGVLLQSHRARGLGDGPGGTGVTVNGKHDCSCHERTVGGEQEHHPLRLAAEVGLNRRVVKVPDDLKAGDDPATGSCPILTTRTPRVSGCAGNVPGRASDRSYGRGPGRSATRWDDVLSGRADDELLSGPWQVRRCPLVVRSGSASASYGSAGAVSPDAVRSPGHDAGLQPARPATDPEAGRASGTRSRAPRVE